MNEGVGRSRGSANSNFVPILVLILWGVGTAAAILGPNLSKSKCCGNETAAIATLRNLASVQSQVQDQVRIDVDGDGVGEYGTLGEMTGTDGVRTNADGTSRGDCIKPPVLSPALAGVTSHGLATKSGHAFRIFLPAARGGAVREERAGRWTGGPGRPVG